MRCGDCQICEADGCDAVAFCLSEPGAHPCPHDGVWCEAHNIENCIDCRLEAEREMYRSGQYDPRADPFYRGADRRGMTTADVAAEMRAAVETDGGYYWDGAFVPRPPKGAA